METAIEAHRRVTMSLVATPSELSLAHRLRERLEHTSEQDRKDARESLLLLATQVAQREQGRGQLAIPRNPERAAPVLAGLKEFTDRIGDNLDLQIRESRVARHVWLGVGISSAFLSLIIPLAVTIALAGGLSVGTADSILPFGALAVACSLVVTVLSYRVFQVTDETARRLKEKKLALTFLHAAVELSEGNPEVASVLERSFDMFLQHYETPHVPLSASDLVALKPS